MFTGVPAFMVTRTLVKNAKVLNHATVLDNVKIFGDAHVSENARIENNVRICGKSRVWGESRIYDNAMIYGNADVGGNAEIRGNAEIFGDVIIWTNAKILGDAKVSSKKHFLVIGPIGSRRDFITFFRDKDGEITVNLIANYLTDRNFVGKLDEFLDYVSDVFEDSDKDTLIFSMVAGLAALQIDLTDEQK